MNSLRGNHIVLVMTSGLTSDQRMIRVATALHDAGATVTMIGREFEGALPLRKQPWQQLRIRTSRPRGPGMYLSFNRRAYSECSRLQPDLLYAVDLDTVMAVSAVARSMNVPWIYDAHEYFTGVPELKNRRWRQLAWRWVERRIKTAAACITVNDSLARILSEHSKRDFEVIRNVPQLQDYTPQDRGGKRLIYQGVVNQGRWVEHYIAVLPELPADIELHIYGTGDRIDTVTELANQSPRSSDIYLHGKLPPDALRQETTKGWLGLNLLDPTSPNYYYSLANKFFDYMHAGVPSLNSNLPEYQAITEQYKVGLCVDNEKAALINVILCVYHDEQFYLQMQQSSLKARTGFCWQQEQDRLLTIVDRQLTKTLNR